MKKKETQLLGIPEEISETKKEEAPKFKEETELKKRFKEKEEELEEAGKLLDKWFEELEESKRALKESREVLEIKVKARTMQLEELTQSLEKRIKERTAELEDSRKALMNMLEDTEAAKKTAEEEKDKTLAIIDNFADGLLILDASDKLSLINPRAEKIFDIKGRDIIGRTVSELDTFPTLKSLAKLLGQEEIKGIFRKELPLGEKTTVEVSTISMTKEGEKLGAFVVLHDITREKKVERLKTEFVSLSAHQLRTPLSAIKWTLRMLLDGDLGELSPEQREFLEKTYKSNERMIVLVNDLLDVTRIEEGRYIYKLVLADIEALTQFVISSRKEEFEKRKIKLKFKKPEKKLPEVEIDVERIKVVIQNLLENALRYTPVGGDVIVSLRHYKDRIEFSVKDTGMGIPVDQQSRIFTKFFRSPNAVRAETEGSGLGLFISKNIIEAHGGKIGFESEENKGSTFHFSIPLKEVFPEFLATF